MPKTETATAEAVVEAAISNAAEKATAAPRKERYLRNRPFLIIKISRRPAKAANVRTEMKGWGDDPGKWSTFEQPSVVDRVNSIHEREAAVIIDVLNGTVVKNQFSGNSDEEVVNHYLTKYKAQVTQAMDIWLTQTAQKVARETAVETGVSVTDGTFTAAE